MTKNIPGDIGLGDRTKAASPKVVTIGAGLSVVCSNKSLFSSTRLMTLCLLYESRTNKRRWMAVRAAAPTVPICGESDQHDDNGAGTRRPLLLGPFQLHSTFARRRRRRM